MTYARHTLTAMVLEMWKTPKSTHRALKAQDGATPLIRITEEGNRAYATTASWARRFTIHVRLIDLYLRSIPPFYKAPGHMYRETILLGERCARRRNMRIAMSGQLN